MSNNSIYQQQNVRAGSQISEIKPLINPIRSADSSFSYTFSHWDISDSTIVNSSLVVNAVYDYHINKYTVKFVNNNGVVLQTGEVSKWSTPSYTGNQPNYANPKDGVTYTFKGWNPQPANVVTGDATYYAVFNIIKPQMKIRFFDHRGIEAIDSNAIKILNVDKGSKVVDIFSYSNEIPYTLDNEVTHDGWWSLCGWIGDNYRYSFSCDFDNEDVVIKNIDFYGWYECEFELDRQFVLPDPQTKETETGMIMSNGTSPNLIKGLRLSVADMNFDWTLNYSNAHSHYSVLSLEIVRNHIAYHEDKDVIVSYRYGGNDKPKSESVTYITEDGSQNNGNGVNLDKNCTGVIFWCKREACGYTWTTSNIIVHLYLT